MTVAMTLVAADEFATAKKIITRSIGLHPEHADSHLLLAQILLAEGEYKAGFSEYEWRTKVLNGDTAPPNTAMRWNGMRLHDTAKLFLLADQGFGDALQFSRFIPQAAALVGEVIVGCDAGLLPLVKHMPGVDLAVNNLKDVPGHFAWARLASLPHLLGTTVDTIPPPSPIHVDFAKAFNWGQKLDPDKLRVGLSWAGRPEHPNDAQRSMPLRRLLDLPEAAGERVSFVSLQRDIPHADHCLLGAFPGLRDLREELRDFSDTAALIQSLDLVITVDTSIAHLAASMGKETWVLVHKPADFRWLLNRETSPWYPSVRLFRQEIRGEWGTPVAALTQALKDRLDEQTRV